jgi:hypothetical protein
VPDAVAKFDIKNDEIEKSILSMVPQVPETAVVDGKVIAAPPAPANGTIKPEIPRTFR